ncbi:MAG TPA: site-2 protease family protein [Acidimicrobiales bacterium]|nr:site-2 protease family protein [Acidimicrobiales bacterium]
MNLWYWFALLVPSVVLHELSHGYVAYLCGDPTAKEQHRLTLNPLRSIDPFGTILMPILLLAVGLPAFGYAKPVPVSIGRLRHPRQQALWVSLAGPFTNFALSAVGYAICEYAIHVSQNQGTFTFGLYLGLVNLVIGAFNMLPIPPLDGSAIIERFVPNRHLPRYYQLRARALPIAFLVIIVLTTFTHIGQYWLSDLERWWESLLT